MMFRKALAALVALVFVGYAGTALAQQKVRMQTAVPSASIYFELLKRYADRVDKMSNGRVKIEILPDGAIVPAFEILDAVDKGIVEGGYAWTHYWSGKHPAAGLFSNPMAGAGAGLDQLSHVAWLLEGGGNKLYERFYADILKVNVEPLMVQPMGPDPLGWFKRPIKDVADFKKMKYRSPPGITGEIFKEMGVSAVALPGGEIVPAAQRGTIDAAEWIGPADDRNLGLHTVWKNYYLQGLHQSTDIGEVLINKAWWDKLPADLKEILEGAAHGVDDGDIHLQRLSQRAGHRRAARKARRADPRHAEGVLPGVRQGDEHRARPLCGEGPVLQGGARQSARLRQDRRAVLDEDPRPVFQARQLGTQEVDSPSEARVRGLPSSLRIDRIGRGHLHDDAGIAWSRARR